MRRRAGIAAVLLGAGLFAVPLAAEVYDLGLGGGTENPVDAQATATAARQVLDCPVLYREKLEYNGVDLEMAIGSASLPYRDLARILARLAPKAMRLSRNGCVFELRAGGKWLTRYLISDLGNLPALVIRMEVPEKMPKHTDWPSGLPLPRGAVPVAVVRYPARGAVYGAFRNAAERSISLPETADALRSSGWTPVSGEPYGRHPQGELFLRAKSKELLFVGIDESGNGTVYRRKQGGN